MIDYGTDYTDSRGEPLPLPTDPAPSEPYTELGHARRLVAGFGDQLRHVPLWKKWLVWDGARWAADTTGRAHRRAKTVARGALGWAENASDTVEDAEKLRQAAKKLERSGSIAGILTLAATEKPVALDPAAFDADPWLLNCANGVLDLRTGELLEHDPAMHLTKVTAAAYRTDASAPEFGRFVERILPDADVRGFVQRYLGYALLGEVQEHVLAVFYGVGANGKGTLTNAVDYALGDYALTPDPDLLVDRGTGFHPTSSASLFGARLAIMQETDQGRRLAEGTVKRLTGGDPIAARRMREDFWEFEPSHTFVLATNHRPIVRGNDEGIWRRLRLVPFDVVIPAEERDGELPSRLRTEADGILTWLVNGYHDWREHGLAEPAAVIEATQKYRDESDLITQFLTDRTTTVGMASVKSSQLFAAWQAWCHIEGADAGTQTSFSTALTERGFDRTKRGGYQVWLGLGLLPDHDEDDDR